MILFKDKNAVYYTEINLADLANWCFEKQKKLKINAVLLQDYLLTKGFVGQIKQIKNTLVVFDVQGEAVKMFAKNNCYELFKYLELKANTIAINFKGYRSKTLIPPKGGNDSFNQQFADA